MIFGRDIVFTCGPLVSVYTKMYHPGTETIMLLGSALIGAALSFGRLLLTTPKNRFFIVALPILISEVVIMRDSFLLFSRSLCFSSFCGSTAPLTVRNRLGEKSSLSQELPLESALARFFR
jgi:hypothetical protein